VEITDGRHKKFEGTVEICDKEYPVESIWVQKSKLGGILPFYTHHPLSSIHRLRIPSFIKKCEEKALLFDVNFSSI
jgi:hypothetical protein